MKICVFDQSTQKTGYAVFSGTDLYRWGVIDLHKQKDANTRFQNMCEKIREMIDRVRPDLVVFENIALHSSVSALVTLANLQGAIMQDCYLYHIPFACYAPSSWRKQLGLQGNRSTKRPEYKRRAIEYVKRCYGLTVGDDCAEAICIGLAHLSKAGALPEIDFKGEKYGEEKSKAEDPASLCLVSVEHTDS